MYDIFTTELQRRHVNRVGISLPSQIFSVVSQGGLRFHIKGSDMDLATNGHNRVTNVESKTA